MTLFATATPQIQRALRVVRNDAELEALIMEHLVYSPAHPKLVYRMDRDCYLVLESEYRDLTTVQGPPGPMRIRLKRGKKFSGG